MIMHFHFVFVLIFFLLPIFTSGSKVPKLNKFIKLIEHPEGSVFSLTCYLLSGANKNSNYQFYWNKNRKSILPSNQISINTEDGLSYLKIKNISSNDFGNYSCTVKTDQGQSDIQWTVLQVKSKLIFKIGDNFESETM